MLLLVLYSLVIIFSHKKSEEQRRTKNDYKFEDSNIVFKNFEEKKFITGFSRKFHS